MFQFPYQTTPCSAYVLSSIISALQHAAVDGQLVPVRTGKNVPIEGLFAVPPYLKAVAPFAHPLYIEVSGKNKLVLDTRAFVREDRGNNDLRVVNPNEYELLVLRGRLTQAWASGYASDMMNLGSIVPVVYGRLISESLVRRLGLNPLDQQYLTILATFYYLCLANDQHWLEEDDLTRIAQRVGNLTSNTATTVLQFLDKLKGEDGRVAVLTDVASFVAAIKTVGTSPRLETLNVGLVYAALTGVWFGANAREVVAVGLEYPPNFIALVYCALTDRSYHGTALTKLVTASDKREMGKDFVRSLANFLEMTSHA